MMRQTILLAVAAGAAIAATAAGRPSFHIRLDGALDAEGGAYPVQSAKVSFVPGVRGQAAYLPSDAWLEYAFTTNYLSDRSGSFSVWVTA